MIDIGIAIAAGFAIGAERESRKKPAGISTHCLVIGGVMIFTFLSALVDPNSSSRIAAQVVSGIGFLGAGIILKSEIDRKITNLTTAAAIWCAAAIGMAIGYKYYFFGRSCYCVCSRSATNTSHFKIGQERQTNLA